MFPSDVGVVLSYLGWLHRMAAFVETSDEDATLDVARFTTNMAWANAGLEVSNNSLHPINVVWMMTNVTWDKYL